MGWAVEQAIGFNCQTYIYFLFPLQGITIILTTIRAFAPIEHMRTKLLFVLLFSTFSQLVLALIPPPSSMFSTEPFVVVLDAGHGGHDPGNLGNGYLEKSIALNIVLKVGELLSNNKDIKVIYTRKDDTFVDLYVRGEIANKANADLFVSVHCDSHNSDAHGAGTFVLGLHANKQNFEIAKKENSVIYLEDNYETRYADYDINSPESVIGLTIMQEEFLDQSIALAKMIQDNFSGKLKRNDRKVKQAGFIVLHQTFMPSVLVETGFLTNKNEGSYLNSKKGQAEMGTAIAQAILKYKEGVQPKSAIVSNVPAKEVIATSTEKASSVTPNVEESVPTKMEPDTKDKETASVAVVVREKQEEKDSPKPTTSTNNIEVAPKVVEAKKPTADTKILFKVQIMASGKDLALVPDNFNGLGNISKESYKNLFRYLYGETTSYKAAEKLKVSAALKGYASAYIVAYRNGERISVPEALQLVSQ
jgi:N-acetylmuramoyl-L-alanine amidase